MSNRESTGRSAPPGSPRVSLSERRSRRVEPIDDAGLDAPEGVSVQRDGGREQAILEAAAQLFHASGFGGVGVDEIGQLAGISGPAIYRYFSGKDEILAALFDAAMDRLLLLCGLLPNDPFEALDRLILAHVEFVGRDSALLSVYVREGRSLAEPWQRRLQRRQREHVERWVGVLSRCFPLRSAKEHRAATYAVLGMIHSVAEWPREVRRGTDLSEVLPRWVKLGLGGLGGQG